MRVCFAVARLLVCVCLMLVVGGVSVWLLCLWFGCCVICFLLVGSLRVVVDCVVVLVCIYVGCICHCFGVDWFAVVCVVVQMCCFRVRTDSMLFVFVAAVLFGRCLGGSVLIARTLKPILCIT